MSKFRFFVSILLFAHIIILVWVAWGLPIGPSEAKLYFSDQNIVSLLMHEGKELFPDLDFLNIRFPFLIIHIINLILFYYLSKIFLKDEIALFTSFMIFLLLPGIVSSAVLATSTGITLAVYQGFLILFLKRRKVEAYILISLLLFIDRSSVILYFALFTYALWRREVGAIAFSSILLGASVSIYGIEMHGKPVNYFADTIGLYAAIFSPLIFLYFFYSIYRILLKGDKNIIWHISFTVLVLSLIISLRQRIPIQDFAPFVIVAIPLMVKLFFNSFRVRLPQFRKKYFAMAIVVFSVLIINTLALLFHKPFFLILKEPGRHFAAPFYYPYWCALALKEEGIYSIQVKKKEFQLQLRYYGISSNSQYELNSISCQDCKKVSIRYKNRNLKSCYVSKINN
ncbi:hypothetical protein [Hydrogenimonas thermophila]|uniref:Glycosyltransferase RgtA/B/C/D-like domain-containing protein n=1 Tax=Hydrogenimonas thermophila TaxID=223786 RepID=A0A1I5TVQ1_9BACT|nr:hypothetical protein [Hydrogenimonas thermophila]SFP87162.1 hypothetical protein SAMN05216234_1498 [Hydrogenimonas thermophila]